MKNIFWTRQPLADFPCFHSSRHTSSYWCKPGERVRYLEGFPGARATEKWTLVPMMGIKVAWSTGGPPFNGQEEFSSIPDRRGPKKSEGDEGQKMSTGRVGGSNPVLDLRRLKKRTQDKIDYWKFTPNIWKIKSHAFISKRISPHRKARENCSHYNRLIFGHSEKTQGEKLKAKNSKLKGKTQNSSLKPKKSALW